MVGSANRVSLQLQARGIPAGPGGGGVFSGSSNWKSFLGRPIFFFCLGGILEMEEGRNGRDEEKEEVDGEVDL